MGVWKRLVLAGERSRAGQPKQRTQRRTSSICSLWQRLVVPGFGNVFLGELLVDCKSYRLGMLRFELQGGGASGQQGGPIACANGGTFPPGG